MARYLLARAGVQVAVLEKHADFNRDFRGDTIHPSTLQLMHELGLLDEFLKQPHQELRELRAIVNGQAVPVADFTKLPTRCKFIAFMPQWDFLNFLSSHAKRLPAFRYFRCLRQTGQSWPIWLRSLTPFPSFAMSPFVSKPPKSSAATVTLC